MKQKQTYEDSNLAPGATALAPDKDLRLLAIAKPARDKKKRLLFEQLGRLTFTSNLVVDNWRRKERDLNLADLWLKVTNKEEEQRKLITQKLMSLFIEEGVFPFDEYVAEFEMNHANKDSSVIDMLWSEAASYSHKTQKDEK